MRAASASLASIPAAYLHHSTPDVGPLSDDDVWGLHMGQNISEGMDRSIPDILRSSIGMAEAMAGGVEEAAGVAARFSPDWALSGGWRNREAAQGVSSSVVNVYIDGELLRASGMDEDVWRVLDRAASLKRL